MRTFFYVFIFAFVGLTACQPASTNEGAETETADQEEVVAQKAYTLTPFAGSFEFPDADLQSMTYENGNFNFNFVGYQLGQQTPDADSKMCANSDKGSHIHLIVNTQPYAAKYEAEFAHDVRDGDHKILAFLSRSYHESIKNGKAYIAQNVTVADKAITSAEDITEPVLFYSRPKGTYIGKANTDKVMLDFFLVNADLGDQYRVKAMINDEEHIIDKWQPYYIEGLPMGENQITLTLIDKEGNKVDAPLNPVSRKFTLQADPIENAN